MDIVTCSFGLTKIVTLSPSVVIINNSSVGRFAAFFFHENRFLLCFQIEVEVVETVSDKEQDKWGPVNPEQVMNVSPPLLI